MRELKVGQIWFPVLTLGYGKRVGIWLQGCHKMCRNCISPEYQDFYNGTNFMVKDLMNMMRKYKGIDGLTVSGGEPFDQPEGLLELILEYRREYNEDIVIFTGYTLENLQNRKSPIINQILDNIAVLVDGEYIDERNEGIGMRGSSNQVIHVWKCHERYENSEQMEREVQFVLLKDRLWMIGIPAK